MSENPENFTVVIEQEKGGVHKEGNEHTLVLKHRKRWDLFLSGDNF
jgi:hypothetical protein